MARLVHFPDVVWFQEGPGVRNTQYTSSGVKLLNVANLVDGRVDLSTSNRYISEDEAYGKYRHFLVDDGDFIIASSGIQVDYFDKKMGFIAKNQLPLCMNTSTIRFKVMNPDILDIRYFMYYLKTTSFKSQLIKQIVGSAQLNFGPSHLKKMTIPLLKLEEQKYIVSVLDKVTSLIALRKQQLTKLDELVKARFVEMFGDPVTNPMGWDYRSIREVCCSVYGGGTPSKSHPEYFRGNIPWVSPKDMKSLIVEDASDHITEEAISKSATKLVPSKSVLMVIRSGILKHTLPVAINTVPVTINQDMKAFVPNENILPVYLLYCFKLIESDVLSGVRGVTADNIDFKEFLQRLLPVPPIDHQIVFLTFVENVLDFALTIQQSLSILKVLKQSLTQRYFK